ncbi:MAG: hypothetical protein QGH45_22935 [Myxococcota bacterium]|nr:hypothetical protein [Myxococcota bacterium]
MSRSRYWLTLCVLLPAFALLGCDTDGDGLSNAEEADLGTDPDLADTDGDGVDDGDELDDGTDPLEADSDGDGLDDGEEKDEGCDPNDPDTDGDGYSDFDEVAEDSDPTDEDDKIYEGDWPYNPDKDDYDAPSVDDGVASIGELMARIQMMDQYGDEFDLYDLSGQGKPIVLDISATWCPPCQALSSWLAGGPDSAAFQTYYPNVRQMVDDGDIQWVTVMGQDNYGNAPGLEVLESWEESYPHDLIPLLADTGEFWEKYLVYAWPTLYFIDADMIIQEMPDGTDMGHWDAMQMANDYTP